MPLGWIVSASYLAARFPRQTLCGRCSPARYRKAAGSLFSAAATAAFVRVTDGNASGCEGTVPVANIRDE
jgi:hypothetical protein